jgi:hypothetical protein
VSLALGLANLDGASTPFSPTQVSGLRMWLDPSKVVGSNPITAWADQQGNVYDKCRRVDDGVCVEV